MKHLAILTVFATLFLPVLVYAQSITIAPKEKLVGEISVVIFDVSRVDDDAVDYVTYGNCTDELPVDMGDTFTIEASVHPINVGEHPRAFNICVVDVENQVTDCSIIRYDPDYPQVVDGMQWDFQLKMWDECIPPMNFIYLPLLTVSSQ